MPRALLPVIALLMVLAGYALGQTFEGQGPREPIAPIVVGQREASQPERDKPEPAKTRGGAGRNEGLSDRAGSRSAAPSSITGSGDSGNEPATTPAPAPDDDGGGSGGGDDGGGGEAGGGGPVSTPPAPAQAPPPAAAPVPDDDDDGDDADDETETGDDD